MEKLRTLLITFKTYLLKFYDILLMILAVALIAFLIYNRLRPRIPKDLPIILSIDNVWLYIFTVFILLLIISLIIYGLVHSNKNNTVIFTRVWIYIFNKFNDLYIIIYNVINDWFDINFETYIDKFTIYLLRYFGHNYLFYIITNILPRISVLSIFILDIFYFNKIHYFYIVLPLLLIPLFTKLYIHILKQDVNRKLKEIKHYININCMELDTDPDFILVIDPNLILEQLVLYKLKKRKTIIEYSLLPSYYLRKKLCEIYNMEMGDLVLNIDNIECSYKEYLSELANLASFYTAFDNAKKALQQYMSLLISIIYLIGWLYIIYFSNNDLPGDYFNFLQTIYATEEPFSGITVSLLLLINNKIINSLYIKNTIILYARFTGSKATKSISETTIKSINKNPLGSSGGSLAKSIEKPTMTKKSTAGVTGVTDTKTNLTEATNSPYTATKVPTAFNGIQSSAAKVGHLPPGHKSWFNASSPTKPDIAVGYVNAEYRKATPSGEPLPSYEINHLVGYDRNTGKIFCLFTSQSNQPGSILLSETKLDGTSGCQYVAPFQNSRYYHYNSDFNTSGIKEVAAATSYANQPGHIHSILDLYIRFTNVGCVSRVHREDSSFYEENGQRTVPESIKKTPVHNASMSNLVNTLTGGDAEKTSSNKPSSNASSDDNDSS